MPTRGIQTRRCVPWKVTCEGREQGRGGAVEPVSASRRLRRHFRRRCRRCNSKAVSTKLPHMKVGDWIGKALLSAGNAWQGWDFAGQTAQRLRRRSQRGRAHPACSGQTRPCRLVRPLSLLYTAQGHPTALLVHLLNSGASHTVQRTRSPSAAEPSAAATQRRRRFAHAFEASAPDTRTAVPPCPRSRRSSIRAAAAGAARLRPPGTRSTC